MLSEDIQIMQLMEDVMESIHKIELMEQLSNTTILKGYDRNNIQSAISSINSIMKRHFDECLKHIEKTVNMKVNAKLGVAYRPELTNGIFKIRSGTDPMIILRDTKLLKINNCTLKEYENIKDKIPEFVEQTYNMVTFITQNRVKLKDYLMEIVEELKQQVFITEPDEIRVESKIYDPRNALEKFIIWYSDKYNFEITFDYSKEFANLRDIKESIRAKVFDHFNRKIIQGSAAELQTNIENICRAYSLKPTKFMNFPETSEQAYDFKEGYINKKFKLTKLNQDKFAKDLIESINAINYIKNQKFFIGQQSIIAGTKYYCKFLKEEKIGDDVYTIYDIRNGEKPLIEIFKNGIMLSNRQRTKMINHFGYGRK